MHGVHRETTSTLSRLSYLTRLLCNSSVSLLKTVTAVAMSWASISSCVGTQAWGCPSLRLVTRKFAHLRTSCVLSWPLSENRYPISKALACFYSQQIPMYGKRLKYWSAHPVPAPEALPFGPKKSPAMVSSARAWEVFDARSFQSDLRNLLNLCRGFLGQYIWTWLIFFSGPNLFQHIPWLSSFGCEWIEL